MPQALWGRETLRGRGRLQLESCGEGEEEGERTDISEICQKVVQVQKGQRGRLGGRGGAPASGILRADHLGPLLGRVWGSGESVGGNFVCFQIPVCLCFPSIAFSC